MAERVRYGPIWSWDWVTFFVWVVGFLVKWFLKITATVKVFLASMEVLKFFINKDLEWCLFSIYIHIYIHTLWFCFDTYRHLLQYLLIFSSKHVFVKHVTVNHIINIIAKVIHFYACHFLNSRVWVTFNFFHLDS